MAYTAQQYAAQNRIMERIRAAYLNGLCPVCHARPSGAWPDGCGRITCGHHDCYTAWLNIRPAAQEMEQTA